jgi:hypothetical protein
MPHFYFDIRKDNFTLLDDTGLELPDLIAAQTRALHSLAALAPEVRPSIGKSVLAVEVRTPNGLILSATLSRNVEC